MKLPRWKWWQWTLAVFAGLMVLSVIGNLISPTEPTAPVAVAPVDPVESLREENSTYRNVRLEGRIVHVETKVRDVDAAAREVERIGRWLAKNPSVTADTLSVKFLLGTVDRLGNEGDAGMFDATFSVADMRAAKFDNLSWSTILGLAATASATSLLGLQSVAEWCAVEDNVSFTGASFCDKALA